MNGKKEKHIYMDAFIYMYILLPLVTACQVRDLTEKKSIYIYMPEKVYTYRCFHLYIDTSIYMYILFRWLKRYIHIYTKKHIGVYTYRYWYINIDESI